MPDIGQEYKKQIKELEQQVRLLKEQVDFLTRKLYGTKSEKTSALETEGQMSLFNEMESCADPDAHEPDLVEVEKHLRKRKYAGQREKLIKDIPRSKVLHTIDEREQICERCGGTMVKVGEEFVRTEVQFIPASLKVIDHYRETYECRACRKNGTPYMEKSPVPYSPVMHSLASASTIAWLIHQKFELGIPLYRQEKEWEAMGLSLSRATMSNWLLCVYRDWLSHVAGRLRRELLKQEYLHIDETHVQVLKEPGRKNTSDSYMWVYCSIRDCRRTAKVEAPYSFLPGEQSIVMLPAITSLICFSCISLIISHSFCVLLVSLLTSNDVIESPGFTICIKRFNSFRSSFVPLSYSKKILSFLIPILFSSLFCLFMSCLDSFVEHRAYPYSIF